MIEEAEIQEALDYLSDNVDEAAQARANKIYLTEYRKVLKAELMGESNEPTTAAQERHAYAHPRMKEFLKGLRQAVYKDAFHEFKRDAAETKISAWQTQIKAQQGPRP